MYAAATASVHYRSSDSGHEIDNEALTHNHASQQGDGELSSRSKLRVYTIQRHTYHLKRG